jgi:hypothetical protein
VYLIIEEAVLKLAQIFIKESLMQSFVVSVFEELVKVDFYEFYSETGVGYKCVNFVKSL